MCLPRGYKTLVSQQIPVYLMAAAKHIDFLNVMLCNIYYVVWFFNSKSMSTNKSNWLSVVELWRIMTSSLSNDEKTKHIFFRLFYVDIPCGSGSFLASFPWIPAAARPFTVDLYNSLVSFSIPQTIMEIIIVPRIMHTATRVIYRTRTYINLVSAVSIGRRHNSVLNLNDASRIPNTHVVCFIQIVFTVLWMTRMTFYLLVNNVIVCLTCKYNVYINRALQRNERV